MTDIAGQIEAITGPQVETYQARVEQVYADDPRVWRQAIGTELWFQFGVYDGNWARSLNEAGRAYFDQQLDLSGVDGRLPIQRVLDIGFGWGTTLVHLARRFPQCILFDGVNISLPQTQYAVRQIAAAGLSDRVRPYLCNARDISLIENADRLYDLVVMRGSIGHLPSDVLEGTLTALAARTNVGATLVISETFYNVPVEEYQSAVPDDTDRLACGHRKTLPQVLAALKRNAFAACDVRVLPSNDDATHWLQDIKTNIDRMPQVRLPRPLKELRDVADNLSTALSQNSVSVYSVIARRQ